MPRNKWSSGHRNWYTFVDRTEADEYLMDVPSAQELTAAVAERWSSYGAPAIAEGDFDRSATAIVNGRIAQSHRAWGYYSMKSRWHEDHKNVDHGRRGGLKNVLKQLEED